MAAKTDAASVVSKWKTGVSTAGQAEYKRGVNNTEVDWQAATLKGAQNWQDKIQQAIANNSFSRGVQRRSNEYWRTQAATRGAANWASNTPRAETKYQDAMTKVLGVESRLSAEVKSMPNVTIQDKLARVEHVITGLQDAAKNGALKG